MKTKILSIITFFIIFVVFASLVYFSYIREACSYTILEESPFVLVSVNGTIRGHFTFPAAVEGNAITTLGRACLDNQKHITKVTIPDGIVEMRRSIQRCDNITELYIGKDLKETYSPLITSPKLEKIFVDEKNPYYHVDNGCLIDRRNNWMYLATNGAVIPDYVELIAAYAFSGHILTEDLIIPDGVKEIDEYAMCGLTGKANVYIPKDTYVWWSAFYGSSKDVTFCFEAEQNSTGEWMAEQGYSVRFGVEIPQQ